MELKYETIHNVNYVKAKGRAIVLAGDTSNCKLSYIHQSGCLVSLSDESKKEVIDFALKYLKGCVILNTINEKVALFIKKTYPIYYYHEVPIGYSGKFQYHVCFKNTVRPNSACRNPKEVEKEVSKEQIVKSNYSKIKIKNALRRFLKSRNISLDFLDDFIAYLVSGKRK